MSTMWALWATRPTIAPVRTGFSHSARLRAAQVGRRAECEDGGKRVVGRRAECEVAGRRVVRRRAECEDGGEIFTLSGEIRPEGPRVRGRGPVSRP